MTTGQVPQPRSEKDQLTEALNKELEEWSKIGMSPASIQTDHFVNQIRLGVLIQELLDKGILDNDEMDLKIRRSLLENFQLIREQNEEAAKKIQTMRRIIGPNGRPLA